jgi:excisionase family DNA binding protein
MNDTYTTREVARMLGMAVRSVQLMVDRGELQAWKTPGGHRRIDRGSVERWQAGRGIAPGAARPSAAAAGAAAPAAPVAPVVEAPARAPCVLLIEDSVHFRNLIGLLLRQQLPQVELHVAADGISGLAMAGRLQPDVLVVDILLPGIDGATLITSLRSDPQFSAMQLIVVTSLDETQRAGYAYALADVPVVHKPRLVAELPALLRQRLGLALPAEMA